MLQCLTGEFAKRQHRHPVAARKILTFAYETIAVNGFKVSETMALSGSEISLGAVDVFLAPFA